MSLSQNTCHRWFSTYFAMLKRFNVNVEKKATKSNWPFLNIQQTCQVPIFFLHRNLCFVDSLFSNCPLRNLEFFPLSLWTLGAITWNLHKKGVAEQEQAHFTNFYFTTLALCIYNKNNFKLPNTHCVTNKHVAARVLGANSPQLGHC